jgi:prepilin-type N-terminal cleavage/methylation domain-containing protein
MDDDKSNRGFTLIELIVSIVIIAILIGVTILGINRYVAQARLNTDLNNASTINSILPNVMTSSTIYKYRSVFASSYQDASAVNNGNTVVIFHWSDTSKIELIDGGYWWVDADGNKATHADWGSVNEYTYKVNGYDQKLSGVVLFKAIYESGLIPEFPECQSGGEFVMMFYFDSNGLFRKSKVVVCSPLSDESVSMKQDYTWDSNGNVISSKDAGYYCSSDYWALMRKYQ